jgi:medium-chain acyl-[acyl-carrier-protein] hydrolase
MPLSFFNTATLRTGKVLRLFCFPYAGGGAAIYQHWQQHAPDWLQICPLELPGRGRLCTENPFISITELAAEITSALYPYTNVPYALFGHSMGATIAYEVACGLEAAGRTPARKLFVSGARAPFLTRRKPPVSHLADVEFLAHVRDLNGTPAEILANQELMAVLLPVLRADFALGERYRMRGLQLLRAPITALAGNEDEETPASDVQEWKRLTSGPFHSARFPGDHFFIRPNEASIVDLIRAELSSGVHPIPSAAIGSRG